jgi:hypothetical protein
VERLIKAIIIAIIGCGLLIASFYVAYLFLALAAIAIIGGIAYVAMAFIDNCANHMFDD